jgi:hypothetical protein
VGLADWFSNLLGGAAVVVPVQESGPGLDYADPDLNLPGDQAAQNWRRLTQSSTDLSPLTHERAQEMALYLSDRNPLAKGVVDLLTAFVVGEGFAVTAKDQDVRASIDRFWDDGQNEMSSRVEDLTRELAIYGEQVVLAFVNEASGRVALVSADPRTVTKVAPDPLASDRASAVCFGSASVASEERWVKIITEDDDPRSDTFGHLVGQRPGETLKVGSETIAFYEPPGQDGTRLAGCFFFAINKPRSAMRGRSDLLPVADFVDLYDRLIFDEAERMSFLRAFVWNAKVTGASQEQLKERARTEPAPKPGSVKFTNESEEWTAVSPRLNSDDSQNTADLILSLVATGVGLPKVWLNGLMDANRATAQESGEPALKRLVARQRYVRRAITRMVRFALDCAETAGALKDAGDGRHDFTVSTPEMNARDLERAARSLLTTTQAMGMANAARWIDDQTAQEAVALLAEQLGLEIDLADLRARLKQAADDAAQTEDAGGDGAIPGYFGMGKAAGSDQLSRALKDRTNGSGPADHAAPVAAVSPQAKDMAGVIATVSKALVDLGNARVIDGEFAQEVVAKLFAGLGVEVDIPAMQQRLEQEQADAQDAGQVPPTGDGAPPAGDGAALPPVDALVNLDAEAIKEVYSIGADSLEGLGVWDHDAHLTEGLSLLTEAFEASLHPRGPGGQFASKPGSDAQAAGGDGSGGGDLEARLRALVQELTRKTAAQPKKPRKPGKPTLNRAELASTIQGLAPGASVTVTLANGLEVSGTVTVRQGGVAMLQTGAGKYAVLHDHLTGVASISSGDKTTTPGPRTPRTRRAPAAA